MFHFVRKAQSGNWSDLIHSRSLTLKKIHTLPINVPRELVINWHVTEACNYGCRYCYAKWVQAEARRELIHDVTRSTYLLEELRAFFTPGNPNNPLAQQFEWTSIRLNLAGGEPLLYDQRILWVAQLARQLGFEVSIITNASRLHVALMSELAGLLSILGISLDSAYSTVNRTIGRQDRQGNMVKFEALMESIAAGRNINPALRLKVNTVVNAVNHDEDMAPVIRRLAPEKWKVLRMLPSVTDELAISTAQFSSFVSRHTGHGLPLCVEDNVDMTQSYIMIDPDGRFFQNAIARRGYRYSLPIPDVGAAAAFSQIKLSAERYLSRYPTVMGAR